MTKTILCFGDSLTWGYNAETLGRHRYEDRWPSVLQAELGAGFRAIAEGLNGRTTAFEDGLADCERHGARVLPTLLETHKPLDLVIAMLGTNDMKPFICGRAIGAKQGMERIVEIVKHHVYDFGYAAPEMLVVAPPALCKTPNEAFDMMFGETIEESKQLARLYGLLPAEMGCAFFDAGSVAKTTPLDGVHLDAENTRAIGRALAPVVRDLLKN
ncbi:MAG: SGNH/GDSL hydrolase family protein [Rhizobiaceae bacterium]|nr:SGNH/GDSL hydrolase family protein [Rhizobiaceae bacterium]